MGFSILRTYVRTAYTVTRLDRALGARARVLQRAGRRRRRGGALRRRAGRHALVDRGRALWRGPTQRRLASAGAKRACGRQAHARHGALPTALGGVAGGCSPSSAEIAAQPVISAD